MKRNAIKGLLFALLLFCSPSLWAYDFSDDSTGTTIYYTITSADDLTVEVAQNSSYSGAIVIPSTVEYENATYSVTGIGAYAFNSCAGLTSIDIPSSVKSIGANAFYDCYDLTSIEIPNSVTSIGDRAFYQCSGLASVEIPSSVTSIGAWAFASCSALTSITIPDGVTSIGDYAFYSCI